MDNISRFYRIRYEEAKELARLKRTDEALDICWEMRLQPDLSLYRRAHVNLLIASIINVEKHRNAAKYASECLDLIELVKSQGFQVNEEYLSKLSVIAHKVKGKIEKRALELRKKEPRAGEPNQPLALEYLGVKLVRDLRDEFGESALGQMTLQERQPLLIEGMYTGTVSLTVDDVGRIGEQMENLGLEENADIADSNPLNLPTGNPNLPTPMQKIVKHDPKAYRTI